MAVTKYEDVVNLTSKLRNGLDKWWWKVKDGTEDDILYATFKPPKPDRELRERAVIAAYASKTNAVAISESGEITEIPWVDPLEPPFTAPSHVFIIQRNELTLIRKIKNSVDVVEYKGIEYIHKYMTVSTTFYSFALEIENYEKTLGSPYLARLHYVVTHKGVNRGLLIEYLYSQSLNDIQLSSSEKYIIIGLILDALTDLEARGYYPQDLKLSNLLLDSKNRTLHVIDLGSGLTMGMYRPESERKIMGVGGKMESRDMLYTFGRTVWDLYDEEYPEELRVPLEGSLPPLIERMVTECCEDEVDPALRIVDIRDKYQLLLQEAAESKE